MHTTLFSKARIKNLQNLIDWAGYTQEDIKRMPCTVYVADGKTLALSVYETTLTDGSKVYEISAHLEEA